MSEKKHVFKFVDEFVFKQIDTLKQSQPYQEVMRQLNSLSDFQLKAVNQAASLILVTAPLLVFLIMIVVSISFNSSLDMKRNILSEINGFTSAQKQLQAMGKNIISGKGLTSRGQFSNQITNSISTAGGVQSNVRLMDFDSKPKDGIVKATGVVSFSKVSTKVLSRFLADLVDRNKFRISNLKIEKNLKDNVVKGRIELLHYGRAPEAKK